MIKIFIMETIRHLNRKPMRLQSYDYSLPNYYFITICTYQKQDRFGEVINDQMILNSLGDLVKNEWLLLPFHYEQIDLDEFIVMPNHVHGIIIINPDDGLPNKNHGLPEFIRGFKTWSARKVNERLLRLGQPLWQRSFYDHIIRDEDDLNFVREYIINNPIKWALSREP